MEYSYKFRIYPNKTQENLIQRTFGRCRFVFNYFLAERMGQYKQTGHAPTRFQQDKALTVLKKELEWLRSLNRESPGFSRGECQIICFCENYIFLHKPSSFFSL
ncbi:MAG: helix-turn-helix domain-containing protein [Oscillospiraceae bacterium]|nr:helix-turn-helix domain-containing protein [Oscillospiraceae bacterium]